MCSSCECGCERVVCFVVSKFIALCTIPHSALVSSDILCQHCFVDLIIINAKPIKFDCWECGDDVYKIDLLQCTVANFISRSILLYTNLIFFLILLFGLFLLLLLL